MLLQETHRHSVINGMLWGFIYLLLSWKGVSMINICKNAIFFCLGSESVQSQIMKCIEKKQNSLSVKIILI